MQESNHKDQLTASIAKAYVREMLDLNPMWQAPEIIRRRREIWTGVRASGVAARDDTHPAEILSGNILSGNGRTAIVSSVDPLADQRLRHRARRCLATLEAEFYQLPDEKLDQYLRFLQSDRLPEFAAKARHLRLVADQRSVLLGVGDETDDQKFTYSLLNSLVCPAAQAGALREQYIESIVAEQRVVPACKMVKDFVARHAEIYHLERDWFDLLLDPDNCKQWTAKYSWRRRYRDFVGNGNVNFYVAVVGLVIAGLVGAINLADDQQIRAPSEYNNGPGAKFNPRANIPRPAPWVAPPFSPPSPANRSADPATDTNSKSRPESLEPPSGLGSPIKSADQILREMHERNRKFLESHQSMMNDPYSTRPGSSLWGTDPADRSQQLLHPPISIPEFPTPNLDPNRFGTPRLRPGQLRRPMRRDAMR